MNVKGEELVILLEEQADLYLEQCLSNTSQKLANTGKIVEVIDRHIPTVDYFVNIYLQIVQKNEPDFEVPKISRKTFYNWLRLDPAMELDPEQKELLRLKLLTIKRIDAKFRALATDIVANEGKGIFYAKNRLGMTDKLRTDGEQRVTTTVINLGSGVKPPNEEDQETPPAPARRRVVLKAGVKIQKKKK